MFKFGKQGTKQWGKSIHTFTKKGNYSRSFIAGITVQKPILFP